MRDPLATPQRIAFMGDWHGDRPWALAAVAAAVERHADVIVHTGDFGYDFNPRFLNDLGESLEDAGVPLLFVDGNHEDHRWLRRQPIAANGLRQLTPSTWHMPRGFRWEWDGVRFVALGGAHSVDGIFRRQRGDMWQREERITDEEAAAVIAAGHADVLISHDCPAGVPIPGLDPEAWPLVEILRADEHRQLLRTVVDEVQPRLIVHGHYHVRYSTNVDLGYGRIRVKGLHMNNTSTYDNMTCIDLDDLVRLVQVRA